MKMIISGDAMIPGSLFEGAVEKHLKKYVENYVVGDFETVWSKLQERRLLVEQSGPEIEVVPEVVLNHPDAEILTGLFVPVSSKLIDALPKLKVVGLARAGKENINLDYATKRGVLAFNIMGRNAEAVSDFTIGMMLAESRNIARAHMSIKNGGWQKEFSNISFIPQLKGKKVGIAGFGYIGQLVAQKLTGWDCEILVYDKFASEAEITELGYTYVDKETLFKESDYLSINLRLVPATKGWVDKEHLDMMKKTAVFVNTGRSGLIDMDYLYEVLKEKRIAGAALDVFNEEPIDPNSPFITLDNVTLTTHIAGTTTEALTGSPYILMEEIERFFKGEKTRFVLNPEVLENPEFKAWLEGVRNGK
ncbi:2-hydroxyacid dehydrogenase [Candidatus Izemoplasma sp. B36]|uniref:2-hydroxyacid dehydrogenase n=1 Tax=Candidatus Izemoplasma sp. B36 TaxID=3242468 RepID=UPI003556102B